MLQPAMKVCVAAFSRAAFRAGYSGRELAHHGGMDPRDSALDPVALAYVRALLRPKRRSVKLGVVLTAAAFAALCAISFATVMVLAPPAVTQHLPDDRLGVP